MYKTKYELEVWRKNNPSEPSKLLNAKAVAFLFLMKASKNSLHLFVFNNDDCFLLCTDELVQSECGCFRMVLNTFI